MVQMEIEVRVNGVRYHCKWKCNLILEFLQKQISSINNHHDELLDALFGEAIGLEGEWFLLLFINFDFSQT